MKKDISESTARAKNVWLIKEGETALPVMKEAKPMRTGSMADYFASKGHNVIWWSSGFLHGEKRYLYDEYKEIEISSNYLLILLHSDIAYKKNISFSRIKYHDNLAKQFKEKAESKQKPDIIVCSYPTLPFAEEAIRYGKKHEVPVILDVRDEWPDIFVRAFPKSLWSLANIALYPLKRKTHKAFSNAAAITAMVPSRLKWGLNYARRKQNDCDAVVFIGCKKLEMPDDVLKSCLDEWKKIGVSEYTWNICIFTTLSEGTMDLDTVIYAIKKIAPIHDDVRFIIGGAGDAYEHLVEISRDIPEVQLTGWLNQNQMQSLMKISKCGMLCYKNTSDFRDAFGNKGMQYMSEGLPVITSTEGFAKEYLEKHNAGVAYTEGDIDDCVEKIRYLYENPDIAATMSRNSLTRFYQDFEADIVNSQYEGVIEKVVHKYLKEQ